MSTSKDGQVDPQNHVDQHRCHGPAYTMWAINHLAMGNDGKVLLRDPAAVPVGR
jgi:hypothetical protein